MTPLLSKELMTELLPGDIQQLQKPTCGKPPTRLHRPNERDANFLRIVSSRTTLDLLQQAFDNRIAGRSTFDGVNEKLNDLLHARDDVFELLRENLRLGKTLLAGIVAWDSAVIVFAPATVVDH